MNNAQFSMKPNKLAYIDCCTSTVQEYLSCSLLLAMEQVYEYSYILRKIIDRISFICQHEE